MANRLEQYLKEHCTFVAYQTGAGGGGKGLGYQVYKRKPVGS